MKEKGFTLIELLGVIIILSLIMLIAIPNITSTLERSKREQYLVDARKFVSLVEYELRKGNIDKPLDTELLKITLSYLNTNDLEKDPDGKDYDKDKSYVIVARQDGYLTYYVTLLTEVEENVEYKGLSLVKSQKLEKDGNGAVDGENRYNLIKNGVTIASDAEIKNAVGIVGNVTIKKY